MFQSSFDLGHRPFALGQVTNMPGSQMIPNTSMAVRPVAVTPGQRIGAHATPEVKVSGNRERFEKAVGRLCTMMRDGGSSEDFWTTVEESGVASDSVVTGYRTLCPEFAVPRRPLKALVRGKLSR